MLTESILVRLQYQHLGICEIIAGLPADKLQHHPEKGKWTILENWAHLVSYQVEFLRRVKRILDGENPTLRRYVSEEDPDFQKTREMSAAELWEKMKNDHDIILVQVQHLGNMQLTKKGIHPVFGELDVSQWVEFFLLHEAHHMLTIFKLAHVRSPDPN